MAYFGSIKMVGAAFMEGRAPGWRIRLINGASDEQNRYNDIRGADIYTQVIMIFHCKQETYIECGKQDIF